MWESLGHCGRCHPGQVVLGGKESEPSKLGCKPGSSFLHRSLPWIPAQTSFNDGTESGSLSQTPSVPNCLWSWYLSQLKKANRTLSHLAHSFVLAITLFKKESSLEPICCLWILYVAKTSLKSPYPCLLSSRIASRQTTLCPTGPLTYKSGKSSLSFISTSTNVF